MTDPNKPLVLLILDGFGHAENTKHNAIEAANTPIWNTLWRECPRTLIQTSGLAVGLPDGQMGNSEVGHMTLGAGRIVYQNYTRINKAIAEGDFFTNPAYVTAIDKAVGSNKAVHILGLLSPGGVHSHGDHFHAVAEMAASRGVKNLYVHAFLDGRDTPPRSAEEPLLKMQAKLTALGVGQIATLTGRFYAMDRDQRWDRVQAAYDLLTLGKADYRYGSVVDALHAAYLRGENDEFVKPTTIANTQASIADGDSVIFMNFRPDRARQLTRAFTDPQFEGFEREKQPKLADFVMTTEYAADINTPCAYPPQTLDNSLGDYLAKSGKSQLRIAETEKYAHVTFFFSGGQEAHYPGEERILVPSPKVETYDQKPEMSAYELTTKLVQAIESDQFEVIICNYANCDQVGHTGVFDAAVKAVEVVDDCLGKVLAAIRKKGGEALITADHGNVEQMYDPISGQAHTQHTTLPVPLVYVGGKPVTMIEGGSLADVAPTVLALLGLTQPAEMTGRNLAVVQ